MFDITKALESKGATLIDVKAYEKGGAGTYPSCKVLVDLGGEFVIWTAFDQSIDGGSICFCWGHYFADLTSAIENFSNI